MAISPMAISRMAISQMAISQMAISQGIVPALPPPKFYNKIPRHGVAR